MVSSQAYWVNTGKNEILEDVMKTASEDINEKLFSLLQGNRVIARIDQTTVYRSLSNDPANIYSILLVAGYLKTQGKELQADEALRQIDDKEYVTEMKDEGVSDILKIGMAFSGKNVVIKAL